MTLDPWLIVFTRFQNEQLRKDLELSQSGQTMLIDKLIACCKEVRMSPVNPAYPFPRLLNIFTYTFCFNFWVALALRMLSRTRNGHNGCSRRYEKNWRSEGQSLQLVGIEQHNTTGRQHSFLTVCE
jgi:hypothetical protein